MQLDRNTLLWMGVAFLIGVAAGMAGLTLSKGTRPAPIVIEAAPPTSTPAPTATLAPIQVYVSGAVVQPAVYSLPPDSRVVQAVEAAGGFTADANAAVVNLAQPLSDGAQVYVPAEAETAAAPPAIVNNPVGATRGGVTVSLGSSGSDGSGLVNINTASAEELDTLPGVGPSTAQNIIAHREANGLFASIEAIMEVSGIGEAKFEQIREQITVGD